MDLLNQAIPPAVLLLGASNLTRALYGVAPAFANHVGRFVPLGLALTLTGGYVALVLLGPIFRLVDVPAEAVGTMGIVLLGLGAGFLIASLLLILRRPGNK